MDGLFERDWVLKLLALALAVGLWAQVVGGQDPIITRYVSGVRVEAVGYRGGGTYQVTPTQVQVEIRGPRSSAGAVTADQFAARVSLRGIGPGVAALPLEVSVPQGVELVAVDPSTVTVRIEPEVTLRRKVAVLLLGETAPGTYAGRPQAQPGTVAVTGPQDRAVQVAEALATLALAGQSAGFSASARLVPVDRFGRTVSGVRVIPSRVRVRVPVRPYPPIRLPIEVRFSGSPAPGYRISSIGVTPGTLPVRVAPQAAPEVLYTVPVNVAGLRHSVVVPAQVQIPPDAAAVGATVVEVQLEVQPSAAVAPGSTSGPAGP